MSSTCNVPRCTNDAELRGVCRRHYYRAKTQARRGAPHLMQYLDDPLNPGQRCPELWDCRCPDARHDDWECPTCRRPSWSSERRAALSA